MSLDAAKTFETAYSKKRSFYRWLPEDFFKAISGTTFLNLWQYRHRKYRDVYMHLIYEIIASN
jgi:hypothetical protein